MAARPPHTGRRAVAVDILQLLDELEAELNAARRVPIGGGVVVDRRRLLDLVEELRTAIPANIRQARGILERADDAIAEAEAAAARIVAEGEREAQARISQAQVVREAQERAYQIELEASERAHRAVAAAEADAERRLAESEARAREQERAADEYALAVLQGLEDRANAVLASVHAARAQFGRPG